MGLWQRVTHFASLVRLSHTLFALPFALSAFVLLWRKQEVLFSWLKVLYVVLAFSAFRSFAMAINRLADASFDAKNPRTQKREIPQGILTKKAVLIFAFFSLALGFFFAFLLSPLAFYLSPLVAALLAGYSYSKRFTWLCHFWLGGAIGLAPLAVSLALTERLSYETLLLSLILLFYIAGFDILYALADEEFDRNHNLYSIPAFFGRKKAQVVSLLSHFLMVFILVYLGIFAKLGWMYYLSLIIILFLLWGEHRSLGIFSDFKKENIPQAFFFYNSAISITLFLGILLDSLIYLYA